MGTFEEFLIAKKIDAAKFKLADAKLFEQWRIEFESYSEASFVMQKKFSINAIRRKYLLEAFV